MESTLNLPVLFISSKETDASSLAESWQGSGEPSGVPGHRVMVVPDVIQALLTLGGGVTEDMVVQPQGFLWNHLAWTIAPLSSPFHSLIVTTWAGLGSWAPISLGLVGNPEKPTVAESDTDTPSTTKSRESQ